MKKTLARWVVDIWYKDAFLGILLLPFAYIFSDVDTGAYEDDKGKRFFINFVVSTKNLDPAQLRIKVSLSQQTCTKFECELIH